MPNKEQHQEAIRNKAFEYLSDWERDFINKQIENGRPYRETFQNENDFEGSWLGDARSRIGSNLRIAKNAQNLNKEFEEKARKNKLAYLKENVPGFDEANGSVELEPEDMEKYLKDYEAREYKNNQKGIVEGKIAESKNRALDRYINAEKWFAAQDYKSSKEEFEKLNGWQKWWAKRLPASWYNKADLYAKLQASEESLSYLGVDVKTVDEMKEKDYLMPEKKSEINPEKAKEAFPKKMQEVYESVKDKVDFKAPDWKEKLDKVYHESMSKANKDFKDLQKAAIEKKRSDLQAQYDKLSEGEKANNEKLKQELNNVTRFVESLNEGSNVIIGKYQILDLYKTMSDTDIDSLDNIGLVDAANELRGSIADLKEFKDNYADELIEPVYESDYLRFEQDGPVFDEKSAAKTFNEAPASGDNKMIDGKTAPAEENTKEK